MKQQEPDEIFYIEMSDGFIKRKLSLKDYFAMNEAVHPKTGRVTRDNLLLDHHDKGKITLKKIY